MYKSNNVIWTGEIVWNNLPKSEYDSIETDG